MKWFLPTSFILLAAALAFADFVPSPLPISPISGSSADPFFTTSTSAPSVRYQQVYAGADFLRYGETRYQITEMAFNAGNRFALEVTVSNLQINFSTTSKLAGGLSMTFAENSGADDNMVFRGSVQVTTTGFEWNMHITLAQPFVFDPRAGNLLMDVQNFQTIRFVQYPLGAQWLMEVFLNGDDGSSNVAAYDVNSATANFVNTSGIRTLFTVTPIPRLSVTLVSTNLLFRWTNKPGGMLLEQSSSISSGSTWVLAGGLVTTNGNYKEVLLPLETSAAAQFFRLVLPPSGGTAAEADVDSKFEIRTPNAEPYVPR